MTQSPDIIGLAAEIVDTLRARGETVCTAESLTAGALSSVLVSIPGASDVFVGAITAYRDEIKISHLDVDPGVLAEHTSVSEKVAIAMAQGAIKSFGTTWAISMNPCETLLQQARLQLLRVSLDIAIKRGVTVVLVREAVGQTLRSARTSQNRTLRDVAREARVSLGYLSEVERGQKEASSELLNAIASALGLSLSGIFSDVAIELASHESVTLTVVDAA